MFNNLNIVSNNKALLVHFISVGQGDAVAINLPDNKTMLIDTGPENANVTFTTYLNENVLGSKRNNYVDYLILTHADADHVGGALRFLKNFKVGTIYLPNYFSNTDTFYNLLDYITQNNLNIVENKDGIVIAENNYRIEFFGPLSNTSSNESCPTIRLEYLNKSFLFTADIVAENEEELISTYGNKLKSDVLKVAHHGSKYSSSAQFLSVVDADYAVISCGKNDFGHPADTVIDNLTQQGSTILRTDNNGNILFAVSKNYNLAVLCGKYVITPLKLHVAYLGLLIEIILVIKFIILLTTKTKKGGKAQ